MRLTKLKVEGLRGKNLAVTLTGRDLILAPNMAGKSTVVDGLSFLVSGAIPGAKDEDLIGQGGPDGFAVIGEWERESGSPLRVLRRLRVKPKKDGTLAAVQEMRVDPHLGETGLKAHEERLRRDLATAEVASFDAARFFAGSDTDRLVTLTGLVGGVVATDTKALVAGATVEAEEGLREAVERVRADLLGAWASLPADTSTGLLVALEDAVKGWTSEAKRERDRKAAVHKGLADLAVAQNPGQGTPLEALRKRLGELDEELVEGERDKAAAGERRKLHHDATEDLRKAREAAEEAERAVFPMLSTESPLPPVKAAEQALAAAKEEEAKVRAEVEAKAVAREAKWKEAEEHLLAAKRDLDAAENALDVALDVEDKAKEALHAAQVAEAAAVDGFLQAQAAESTAEEDFSKWEALGAMATCPTCRSPIRPELHGQIRESLQAKLTEAKAATAKADTTAKAKADTRNTAAVAATDATVATAAARKVRAETRKVADEALAAREEAVKPSPEALALGEATQKVRTLELALERAKGLQASKEATLAERMEAVRKAEAALSALGNCPPEDLVEDLQAGTMKERAEVANRLKEAEDAERRYRDQETALRERNEATNRVEALTAWAKTLKGLKVTLLNDTLGPVLEPAEVLISEALPGHGLAIAWEDTRGRPGLRIGLRLPGGAMVPWAGMSGAVRMVVATSLALAASSSRGSPPGLLAVDADPFDKATLLKFLAAMDRVAGPVTGLLVTSHHLDLRTLPEGWTAMDL